MSRPSAGIFTSCAVVLIETDNTFALPAGRAARRNASLAENRYHSDFRAMQVDAAVRGRLPHPHDTPRLHGADPDGTRRARRSCFYCNPLAAVTGWVCPTFCEEECDLRRANTAVSIREVERFLGDYLLDRLRTTTPCLWRGPAGPVSAWSAGLAGLAAAYPPCARRATKSRLRPRRELAAR